MATHFESQPRSGASLVEALVRSGLFVASTFALIGTWRFLFGWLVLFTEGLLVPWDTWGQLRPPTGTWERTVNDYFNVPPGLFLPSIVFTAISVCNFVACVMRSNDRVRVPLIFAAANILYFVAHFVLLGAARQIPLLWLSQPRPPVDLGFHRTWPGILGSLTLWWCLWAVQQRLATRTKASVKAV